MRVLVLMSTYNGERYVKEQLESILQQVSIDFSILIRDDGSKDDTVKILKSYSSNNKIKVIEGKNCGYIRSFGILVQEAVKMKDYDYFAFADQDDYWYPNKLLTAMKTLEKEEKQIPLLFCSNSDIIDAKGNKKGVQFIKYNYKLRQGNILVNKLTQGCSMFFNRKALSLYAENLPEKTIHDRWLMMLCGFMGGKIIYCHTALFAYRIHENNAIGIHKSLKGWESIKESIRYWCNDNEERPFYTMAKEFELRMGTKMKHHDLIILHKYTNYRKSIFHKIRFIFAKEYYPYNPTLKNIIIQSIHILANKI